MEIAREKNIMKYEESLFKSSFTTSIRNKWITTFLNHKMRSHQDANVRGWYSIITGPFRDPSYNREDQSMTERRPICREALELPTPKTLGFFHGGEINVPKVPQEFWRNHKNDSGIANFHIHVWLVVGQTYWLRKASQSWFLFRPASWSLYMSTSSHIINTSSKQKTLLADGALFQTSGSVGFDRLVS